MDGPVDKLDPLFIVLGVYKHSQTDEAHQPDYHNAGHHNGRVIILYQLRQSYQLVDNIGDVDKTYLTKGPG